MNEKERTELIDAARQARANAVADFSNFKVGAALRTSSGKIVAGCNVENCTYGLTICAERVGLLTALAAGDREFTAVAVVTQSEKPSTPCGPCRQLMWEFCGDIPVFMVSTKGRSATLRLSELVPYAFDKRDL